MSHIQQIIQDNSGLLCRFGVDVSIFEIDDPGIKIKDKPAVIFQDQFKLPICYLPTDKLHALSPIVSQDLELVSADPSGTTMYDYLFKPSNQFAKDMIKEWPKYYTTDAEYLSDTKDVLAEIPKYTNSLKNTAYCVQCDSIMNVWTEVKENPYFMEQYAYIDWKMLQYLNQSQSFLQAITLANIVSPVMSLLLPVLFLVFPFIILKIQNIPITFTVYLDVLRDIAKNHFLGKALISLKTLSSSSITYALFTLGMYLWSVYQNITACQRFYKNVQKINDYLFVMKDYTQYSIKSMAAFSELHSGKSSYSQFCKDINIHLASLDTLYTELNSVQPFKNNIISKIPEVGYMLKCFYSLYSNTDYENALRFSIGFEGYIDNIKGVYTNISHGRVSYGNIIKDVSDNEFVSQYYPSHMDNDALVKNDISLNNTIITGPNASGKTTFLKTTMINIIITQQIGCGFYKECLLTPYTHIHSYLNIPDTSGRDSLFQAESRRCKDILDIIHSTDLDNSRHFCIFDELYSGTNPIEATKSAYSFLVYLSKYSNVSFMLTTHYTELCNRLEDENKSYNIRNYQMEVDENDETGALTYLYKIQPGISTIQGAIKILMDMEYPDEIIQGVKTYDDKVSKSAENDLDVDETLLVKDDDV